MKDDLTSPRTLERLCGGIAPAGDRRGAVAKRPALFEAGKLAGGRIDRPRSVRIILGWLLGCGGDDIVCEQGERRVPIRPGGKGRGVP